MPALRATILLSGAAALALVTVPAQAQVSNDIVLNILRECAKIADSGARLACYDNNIRANAPSNPSSADDFGRRSDSGSAPVSAVAGAAAVGGAAGFGAESIKSPERFVTPEGELDSVSARVVTARERQPGVYRITLENGAEWLFSESVSSSYRPPRNGDTVEVKRASMDSFLLFYDEQVPVRVRRVK